MKGERIEDGLGVGEKEREKWLYIEPHAKVAVP